MDHMGDALTRALVTGANGYLGGHILARLRNQGVKALGVDRSGQCDIVCDLGDRDATKALIAKYPDSRIIHCAAAVPKSRSDYLDEAAASDSLRMVRNLADARPRYLVFVSSMTVYPDNTLLAREDAAALTGKGYAASKLMAEHMLLECTGVTATILRLPGLFGLPRRGGVLFNSALALARGDTPSLDEPLPQWAAMHVDDAADICIRAALASPTSSMVMNAGYPERMAISAAVSQLATLFDRELSVPQPKWFEFDLSRLHAVLGPVSGRFIDRLKEIADWSRMEVHNNRNA